MRCVFVHLGTATEEQVAEFLHRTYPHHPQSEWIMEVDGERVLAIDFYRDTDSEWEVEDWFRLQEALGGLPSASLVAVVAARKDGTAETKEFAEKVLSEFKGVAEDDYAPAFWTLDDLRSDRLFEGHHFFDYRGWPCFLTICDSFKVVEEHRP